MTKTQTPAQQQGFEIGRLYCVVDESTSVHLRAGDIVEFTTDDDSIRPRFKLIEINNPLSTGVIGKEYWLYLDDLAPYDQPTTTKQKLSQQELLLMYVKQHYPEDRVMIAMVENI